MPPLFLARADLDYAAINRSLYQLIQAALEKNAALTLMNHPMGYHGFDVRDKNPRSEEIIRASLEFLHTHLAQECRNLSLL